MKMTQEQSEAIVSTVTKSLSINGILNRISQSAPGILNLLAKIPTKLSLQLNNGLVLWGWWPWWIFLRCSVDFFAFLSAEWLSGNYYLELLQIKVVHIISAGSVQAD